MHVNTSILPKFACTCTSVLDSPWLTSGCVMIILFRFVIVIKVLLRNMKEVKKELLVGFGAQDSFPVPTKAL